MTLILCTLMVISIGCMQQQLSEKEFTLLWREYLTREFIESFDEQQSYHQRKKIMSSILQDFNVNPQTFFNYCKAKHPDKYRLFIIGPK